MKDSDEKQVIKVKKIIDKTIESPEIIEGKKSPYSPHFNKAK